MAVSFEHPSIIAWTRIQGSCPSFTELEVLQEDKRALVYRIHGLGPNGSAVIAKRCERDAARRERFVYEQVLPLLPVTALRLYGFVDEDDDFAWLFVENAEGKQYTPRLLAHRRIAGHWLGQVHTSAASCVAASSLRSQGPDRFFEFLQPAYQAIARGLRNAALTSDHALALRAILSQIEVLESHWGRLQEFYDGMPRTLVHGDFKEDQMRVRSGPDAGRLAVFDWSEVGWGVPALDLAKFLGYSVSPDIDAYLTVVRERWAFMDIRTVHRIGHLGEIFRCLASIRWEAERLRYDWIETPMSNLIIYKDWLSDEIQAAPWDDRAWTGGPVRAPALRGWH